MDGAFQTNSGALQTCARRALDIIISICRVPLPQTSLAPRRPQQHATSVGTSHHQAASSIAAHSHIQTRKQPIRSEAPERRKSRLRTSDAYLLRITFDTPPQHHYAGASVGHFGQTAGRSRTHVLTIIDPRVSRGPAPLGELPCESA